MESLRGEQEIRPFGAMPDVRMLPLQQAQKHPFCDGDPEPRARDPSI